MDEERGIGRNGTLPWDEPADRQWFKQQTMGACVLFGRVTYQSLPKPTLPGRIIGVLSRHAGPPDTPDVFWRTTFADLLRSAQRTALPIFVAGGQALYTLAMPYTRDIWISHIPGSHACDTFFPNLPDDFQLESTTQNAKIRVEHYVRFTCKF